MEIMEKVMMEMGPILQGSMGTCRAGLETRVPTPLTPTRFARQGRSVHPYANEIQGEAEPTAEQIGPGPM